MNEFCKIIQLKEGQVLLAMTFDDDADEADGYYKVQQTTQYNGAQMTVAAGYPTERLQQAHFETFGKEEAEKFFNTAKKFLG